MSYERIAGRLLPLLAGLVIALGCRSTERKIGEVPKEGSAPALERASADAGSGVVDYAKPTLDLSADRLSVRVDGGEQKLRALGCRRLRLWRLSVPPADLELLTFNDEQGPAKMLAEETGGQTTADAPGDAGWIGKNSLYFRRGAWFVRLIADGPESPTSLFPPARDLEHALARGEVTP